MHLSSNLQVSLSSDSSAHSLFCAALAAMGHLRIVIWWISTQKQLHFRITGVTVLQFLVCSCHNGNLCSLDHSVYKKGRKRLEGSWHKIWKKKSVIRHVIFLESCVWQWDYKRLIFFLTLIRINISCSVCSVPCLSWFLPLPDFFLEILRWIACHPSSYDCIFYHQPQYF